jgi:hypothetical protein
MWKGVGMDPTSYILVVSSIVSENPHNPQIVETTPRPILKLRTSD